MPRIGIRSSTRSVIGRSLRSRYLFSTDRTSLHGRQIDVCHVGPLVSQQAGHGEMGVQRRHAAADEGRVLFGGVGMSQPMEGNAPVRCGRVADGVTVAEDELLHSIDGSVGGDAVRHQKLVAAFRFLQQPLQHHRNTVVLDGDDTHLAALALYGEGVFTQRTLRHSGVHTEAFMDTQTGIACQIQGEDVVLVIVVVFRWRSSPVGKESRFRRISVELIVCHRRKSLVLRAFRGLPVCLSLFTCARSVRCGMEVFDLCSCEQPRTPGR